MDYKEKYLKGLEEAKKTLDSLDENYRCHELTKDDIRGIYARLFPELDETEEEKIRKALIFAVRDWDYVNGIESKKVIAYLENLKEHSENRLKASVWKIMPIFKAGDFIRKKGGNYAPWKISEVDEEGGYYYGNYQHGYPTELTFREQRDYERVDNPGMPKINGKPISTENNVVNISHWVPNVNQLEAVRYLLEDYKPWLLCASEARKELATIYDEMLKLAKK